MRYDTIKFLEENIGKTFPNIDYNNVFLGQFPKAKEKQKETNKPNQTYKLFHGKRNHKQNEKTIYWLGENICKHVTNQGLNFENIQTAHTAQLKNIKIKIKNGLNT